MTYIDKTLYLAEEIEKVRKYHQYIWFKTNRLSDRGYVDTLYQDLRDQLTHLLED